MKPKLKLVAPAFPGLTPRQARVAQAKLDAEQDVILIDPKTGKEEPAPMGPSIFDV